MKKRINLILDFNELYRDSAPESDAIVLSSTYENDWTIDVRKFRSDIKDNVFEYTNAWGNLCANVDPIYKSTLLAVEASFFRSVISPISRWIEAINHCFETYEVIGIVFTSYSANDKIFVYEAEGEINMYLLYKKHYYLPYYLHEFLKGKNIGITFVKKVNVLSINFKFYLRNFLIANFIILKQILFKLITFKRNYATSSIKDVSNVFSSRAIVQTEFISNYQKANNASALLVINEQSFRLFKHLKYVKANNFSFLYAEGANTIKNLFSIIATYFRKLNKLSSNNDKAISYQGIDIKCNSFLKDLLVKELDYTFYSTSVKNVLRKYVPVADNLRMISFEMFTPYAYYLKKNTALKTYQIQTTLIEPICNANFIGGDKFYFTNPIAFESFKAQNLHLADKLDCIAYLKYMGIKRKEELSAELKTMCYLTQPIDFDEEQEVIDFLEQYASQHNIRFIIKPHPRQKNIEYKMPGTLLADKFYNLEKLIDESDVVITRSSSVGLDAWLYGVPPVYIKLNKTLQAQSLFYAPNDYIGSVNSLSELETLLNNYEGLLHGFKQHKLYNELNIDLPASKQLFV